MEEPWGFKLSRIAAFLLSFFGVLGVTAAIAGSLAVAEGTVEPAWVAEDSFSFDALNTGQSGGGFDPAAVAAKVREAKAEHEQEISTPAAVAEREDSVDAFTNLSPSKAIDLVTDVFAEPLEALTTLPTDPLLSSETAPKFNAGSDTSARIDPPGAEDSELVVSDTPLRNDEDQVVSGQLENMGTGFEPKAPLTNVELPANADGPVGLSDVDVEFAFGNVANTAGQLVDAADGSGKEMVLYPNTQTDTDTAVTYALDGVETFNYLRSAESPESFSLNYDLPEGASLRATADGGAVVFDSDGEALVTVFPPYAVDAQGTNVPMTLSVDGDQVVLEVPHQGRDFAYPIMVDPIQHVRDWWTNGSTPGFEGWSFYQDGTTQYNYSLDCPSSLASVDPCNGAGNGAGVYVSAVPTRTYPAGSKAYWRWTVPGGASSSITSATLSSWRYRKGNNNAGWAFYNLYNTNTGTSNGTTFTDGGGGSGLGLTGGTSGYKYLQSGLATNTANTIPTGASNWRYNRIAGYSATLTDGEAPTLNLGGGPTAWLPANTTFTVNAEASDAGLGMGWIYAQINGNLVNKWVGWCTGTYPYTCPSATGTQAMSFNSDDFQNGTTNVPVIAKDIIAGTSHETTQSFTVKVDRVKPTLAIGGELYATQNQNLPYYRSSYDLTIRADDRPDPSKATNLFSNIGSIKVKVDGVQKFIRTYPECTSTTTCEKVEQYSLATDDFTDGTHSVSVSATDRAGNEQSSTFTIDIDRRDNVSHATIVDGNPSTSGNVLAEEWKLHSLGFGRTESADGTVETRRLIACDDAVDATGLCTETRTLVADPETPGGIGGAERRLSPVSNDPRLEYNGYLVVAPSATPTSTGSLTGTVPAWLGLPQGHGSTYKMYEYSESGTVEIDADGSDPVASLTRSYYDATTGLPLLTEQLEDGQVVSTQYVNYTPNVDLSSLASDFFGPPIPSTVGLSSELVLRDETWDGQLVDASTQDPVNLQYLGDEITLQGSTFCVLDEATMDYTEDSDLSDSWEWDPTLTDEENEEAQSDVSSADETSYVATYYEANSSSCPANVPASAENDLQVTTTDAQSESAREWKETYEAMTLESEWVEDVLPIASDGLPPATSGVVTLDGQSADAYLVPLDGDHVSTLADNGDTQVEIRADVDTFLKTQTSNPELEQYALNNVFSNSEGR